LSPGPNVWQGGQNLDGLADNLQSGNWWGAGLNGLGLLGNLGQFLRPCFAAGTPLMTPTGSKPIEQFKPGDLVLSAPEDDPDEGDKGVRNRYFSGHSHIFASETVPDTFSRRIFSEVV
jgi:hypothetical protein